MTHIAESTHLAGYLFSAVDSFGWAPIRQGFVISSRIGVYNEWAHVAVVIRSSSQSSRDVSVYVNGTDITSQMGYGWSNRGTYVTGNIQAGNSPFGIGAGHGRISGHGTNVYQTDVTVDSVRIHSKQLTPQDISSIVNGTPPTRPILSAWCFSDAANLAVDQGTQQRNLIITGGSTVTGFTSLCSRTEGTAYQLPGASASA